MSGDWLSRYQAAKGVRQPPPPAPPQQYQQPQYAPPPQQYYAPQPVPGAPAHAPFGYDPATGTPVAPYGYDQAGRILVQPPYAPPPQQPYQQPGGLPPGYPQPGPQQYQAPMPTEVDEQGRPVIRAMEAAAHYQGGEGNKQTGTCPECGEQSLVPRTVGNEGKKLNTQTGQFVAPAPECSNCGYNGLFTQMGSTGGAGSAAGIKVTGTPRLAPGAGNAAQVAHQHGLPNLFAPK